MRIGQSRGRGSELERLGFQFSYGSISFKKAEELRTLEMRDPMSWVATAALADLRMRHSLALSSPTDVVG